MNVVWDTGNDYFYIKFVLKLLDNRSIYLYCRAELGQDGLEKREVKDELSKSRKQIEESRLRLTKLRNDGFDLVTSIRVAGDARENARRLEEEDATKTRKEKLEAEAKAGQERFEEVSLWSCD